METKKLQCSKCKNIVSNDISFCGKCGNKIKENIKVIENQNINKDSLISNKPFKNQENSSFRWFDTKHIKHTDKLSKEDIKWLNSSSVSVFTPFSFIARGQFDLLLVFILYIIIISFSESVLKYSNTSILSSISWIIGTVILVALIIFSIKHLRRLVWNRGFYKTIEEYKKSEKKWNNWGIFFMIMNIFLLIGQFSK